MDGFLIIFFFFLFSKKTNSTIFPVESWWVAFLAVGDGWHNYHHAFPWDYRASELGTPLNMTGFLIDILAKFNLIYDRKEASHTMVENRCKRTGDLSHKKHGTSEGQNAIKTLFNMWKHPMNPTYNSIYSPTPKIINGDGYALIPEELKKDELDEEELQRQNVILDNNNKYQEVKKYIVDKTDAGFAKDNNNNVNVAALKSSVQSKDKSELNINADEALFVKLWRN